METIEEKAKAYDEIIERAKTMLSAGEVMYGKENNASQLITDLIPDLKESEDERIRKELINFILYRAGRVLLDEETEHRFVAYLERQKEPKPDDVKREWWNKGYLEGRKNAHIPARELGLPSSWDFQKEQKPIEFKNDELVEIIKGEFEGFRTLLKKKGIDYEPQRGYWEGFARLFDSSAREYVKEQKEQKPISSCDIVPYIDDKIAALQDMWRKEKVAFDWDDMHEMIEDVARHFYQKEQKPTPDWMPKFLDELRSKKNYFDWDGHRDIEGHILAIINWIDPNYFDRKEKEQKSAEKQDYSGLTDFERAIHRGFLCAGVENVPVTIIKETAQECMAKIKPAEWSDKDKNIFKLALDLIKHSDDCDGILDQELAVKWFAELPSRFVPQPKQEWSKEDENKIESIKGLITMGRFADTNTIRAIWELLDSLRPSWKPSEEQIDCFERLIAFKNPEPEDIKMCESLLEQLKKLCQ